MLYYFRGRERLTLEVLNTAPDPSALLYYQNTVLKLFVARTFLGTAGKREVSSWRAGWLKTREALNHIRTGSDSDRDGSGGTLGKQRSWRTLLEKYLVESYVNDPVATAPGSDVVLTSQFFLAAVYR